METISARVKRLRKEKGWTLEQVAQMANSSKSYIWEIENKGSNFSIAFAADLARALEVSIDYLATGKDDKFNDGYAAAMCRVREFVS